MAGPEINVTFRYNPKKVRRAWGISQVIIDLILWGFLKNTQMQARGSRELLFKNLLYDVHKEKVSERNENDRFQAMASSTNLYNVRLRKSFRAERKL